MSRFWSESIIKIQPYTPGEQPRDKKYIKLNTNENPYPPSKKVITAIRKAANERLKLYPDPTCSLLRDKIAAQFGLGTEKVFVGNGSDEILAFAWKAFFEGKGEVLFPDITYSFYPVYSGLFGVKYRTVPLRDDFTVPAEAFFDSEGGAALANPNAPTGICLSVEEIELILINNPDKVVILDEAYIDFGGISAVSLINEYENLLVIRTLSKACSLAGLRVGFALGQRPLIEGLERVRDSFNSYTLDSLALAGAGAAIEDAKYYRMTADKIIKTRNTFTRKLKELGFFVPDSKANFVFASHCRTAAVDLFNSLRTEGILVRYFDKPRISNFLRISIGTDKQMEQLAEVLRKLVGETGGKQNK